jgi:hypothetical protein
MQVFRGAPDAEWAIGDIYSFPAQLRLVTRLSADRVTLLDDGMATASMVPKLVAPGGRPLTRDHKAQPPWRRILGGLAGERLRRLAAAGRVTVFTALPPTEQDQAAWLRAGGKMVRHSFEWLRAAPSDTPVTHATVLLGSALCTDGLIRPEAYYAWLEAMVRARGPAAYFPHRREDRAELAVRLPRTVDVVDPGIPVEIALRGLGPDHTVFGLASTALATLELVLGESGTRIVRAPVEDAWWTARATPAFRQLAREIAPGRGHP